MSGLFGINISGPEFNPVNNQAFPASSDWAYLGSKGVPFVRLPIAWESIQTSFSTTLNATFLSSLTTAITSAHANGIGVIVDLHNFAAYCTSTLWNGGTVGYAGNGGTIIAGVNYFGDGTLTSLVFGNVWSQLATALVGMSGQGLIGYELMNEPAPWNFSGSPAPLTVAAIIPYYQAAINAIRAVDATTPKPSWTSAPNPVIWQLVSFG